LFYELRSPLLTMATPPTNPNWGGRWPTPLRLL